MLLKKVQQLRFKCKKCNNNWRILENVAILTSNCKSYKSNKVIVNNKCREKKCKSKAIYCYEDCKNIYKIAFRKCKSCHGTKYKINITIQSKND